MRASRPIVVFAVCAFVSLCAPAGQAADEADTQRARALYTQGIELARGAQWGEALAAFEQSLALRPHPVTTYNVGNCERALGRYTRARSMLARALTENAASAQLPPSLATEAKGYVDEIDHDSLYTCSGGVTTGVQKCAGSCTQPLIGPFTNGGKDTC